MTCLGLNRVLAPVLAKRLGTEMTVAQGLMNRLDSEGFLKPAGKGRKLGKLVDKEKITKEGIPKYMKKHERPKELELEKEDAEKEMGEEENDKFNNSEMDAQSEVDKLTEKTESLKIQCRKGKLSRKKKDSCEKIVEVQTHTEDNTNATAEEKKLKEQIDKKRKGRKRAVSKTVEEHEFELSSTQDVFDDPKRRKKASKVSKDIMV